MNLMPPPLRRTALAAALVLAPAASCTSREAVRVEGAWARAADSAATTAAYFTLVNDGHDTLHVTGIGGTCAGELQLHETFHDGGMAGMREVEDLAVPPRSRCAFEPGGRHVMLIGLTRKLTPGLWVDLDLHVKGRPDLRVVAGVRP